MNAQESDAVQWVADEASAAQTYENAVAAASTAWTASEASAAQTQARADAQADQTLANAMAQATREHTQAYDAAKTAFLTSAWPAWAAMAHKVDAANAAWAKAVWQPYASYQIAVMNATAGWVQTVASGLQTETVSEARAWAAYTKAVEANRVDATVSADQAELDSIEADTNPSDFGSAPAWAAGFAPHAWTMGVSDAVDAFLEAGMKAAAVVELVGEIAMGVEIIATSPLCPLGVAAGLYLIFRGVDGLRQLYTGNDRLGNQAIAGLCGAAGCSAGQTEAIVGAAELAQMGLEMFIAGRFATGGRFNCFVAGTLVVMAESSGHEAARAFAGFTWDSLSDWLDAHRWTAATLGVLAGLGVWVLTATRCRARDAREEWVDAAMEDAESLTRPLPGDGSWGSDWLTEITACIRGRRVALAAV